MKRRYAVRLLWGLILIVPALILTAPALTSGRAEQKPAPAAQVAAGSPSAGQDADRAVRLGVYDNRVIAQAWVRSEHNDLGELMREYKRAEAAGDEDRVEELRRRGELLQRKLHFQGFGPYPVDEYLEALRDRLPELLERHELDALVPRCHAHGPHVTTVDVSIDLAMLLGADEAAARKMLGYVEGRKPVDFVTLFQMDPKH